MIKANKFRGIFFILSWIFIGFLAQIQSAYSYNPTSEIKINNEPILDFWGETMPDGIKLQWVIEEQTTLAEVALEYSSNKDKFKSLNSQKLDKSKTGFYQFGFFDRKTNAGNHHYRLKFIRKDGTSYFSSTISMFRKPLAFNLEAVDPPFSKDKINVRFFFDREGFVFCSIYDLKGGLIKEESVKAVKGLNFCQINLVDLNKGKYILKVTDKQKVFSADIIRL